MSEIINMLSYHFMQRALIVGVLVSLCAALLGVSLVLKRYSMIATDLATSASARSQLRRRWGLLRSPLRCRSSFSRQCCSCG